MALYIVVHHRDDPDQPWQNDWSDVDQIAAITTTAEIGRLCSAEKQVGRSVLVHRCAFGSTVAVIACAVDVDTVTQMPGGAYVTFKNSAPVNRAPIVAPPKGTNRYFL